MPNFVAASATSYDGTNGGYLDLDRVIFAYAFQTGSDPEQWGALVFTEPGANISVGGYRLDDVSEPTREGAEASLRVLLGME